MSEEEAWKKLLDIYTQAFVSYAGYLLAAAVIAFTLVAIFPRGDFTSSESWFGTARGWGVLASYALLAVFTAWIASRVVVAYAVMDEAMRMITVRSEKFHTLRELDKQVLTRLDSLRVKYRQSLKEYRKGYEVIAFIVVLAFIAGVLYLYYH
jgi:uncharacterized membrane protein YraQ (UPF0718 family)